ncbi:MAG: crossover junction endodeoxyribonuclease RuvC [Candidatus Omnitrophota bacterium]|nr:crossover junction endodeoxyribonuclease RuvC [Candidatus Omnitrophota bacterium]MDZ4242816.1 crossover junction endodeoxyribonuclease RuvC [Candidatus Omnitrophota bacterium]
MRILGIDPGLKATGYGVIDCEPGAVRSVHLLEAGTVEPRPRDLLQNKIGKVYSNLDAVIQQYSPEVMVIEKLYAHYRHPTTACILGHARGVICLLCAHRELRLVEYPVKRIRKALLGNGNASKEQIRSVVARTLGISEEKLTLDASDALALALGFAYIERQESRLRRLSFAAGARIKPATT